MKDYRKLANSELVVENLCQLLQDQKIIILVLVDEWSQEITRLLSFGCDFESESYYTHFGSISDKVINETLSPHYAYKNSESLIRCAPIDIEDDKQYICSLEATVKNLVQFCCDLPTYHLEYYVSIEKGDFSNFGGPLEIEFLEKWMLLYNDSYQEFSKINNV